MNFKQFTKEIKNQLINQLSLTIEIVEDNNNKPIGIGIINDELKSIEIIELNTFFENYKSTGNIESVINDIRSLYESKMEDIRWYRDFNNIQNHIYYMLLNENVKGILKDAIHDEYLDLVKVYYVYSKDRDMFNNGHIVIHKHHTKMWNITAEDLKRAAEKNMQEQPLEIGNAVDIISETFKDDEIALPEELHQHINDDSEIQLHYMRYKHLKFGAASICNIKALREFSEKHGNKDVFILPSSIYEVILVVNNGENELDLADKYEDIVYDINKNILSYEDILSDTIYIYRYETNTVEII